MDELNAISEHWRGKEPERGFTMALSQDVDGESDEMVLAVARRRRREGGGLPPPGPVLRRRARLLARPHAPRAERAERDHRVPHRPVRGGAGPPGGRAPVHDFAAWGRLFNADAELGPRDRALKWVVEANPLLPDQSLHDFNEKFQPEWLARSMVFEEAADLPHVSILYAGVEGFLNVPVLGRLLVPLVVATRGS